MIRTLLTILAILGMVFQPIAFARSTELQESGMDQAVAAPIHAMKDVHATMVDPSTMDDHAMMSQMIDDEMPCHETASESNADCEACCETECAMMEYCMTSGLHAPVVVFRLTYFSYSQPRGDFLSLAPTRLKKGIPGFIDHPPKHA